MDLRFSFLLSWQPKKSGLAISFVLSWQSKKKWACGFHLFCLGTEKVDLQFPLFCLGDRKNGLAIFISFVLATEKKTDLRFPFVLSW